MKEFGKEILGVMLAGVLLTGGAYAGEGKTAVVNMGRLLKQHPESAKTEALLKERAEDFKAEQTALIEQLQGLRDEVRRLGKESRNQMLSESARERKQKEAEEKLMTMREAEQSAREKMAMRQKQLTDQRRRMSLKIMDDIREIVNIYAREKGYTLVLNYSDESRGGDAVVYREAAMDITKAIAKRMGAEAKPAEKKASD